MPESYAKVAGRSASLYKGQSKAYPRPNKSPAGSLWKVWLVAADCCLIGLQPVLIHLSKDGKESYAYHPISVNVLVEVTRTGFAIAMLGVYGSGKPMQSSLQAVLREAGQQRMLLIPAALYSLNNYLKFMLQLYFKPTTAKMLANLKVLIIAVLMRAVLRRHFTVLQWEALLLLSIGITINQIDHCIAGNLSVPPAAIACTLASLLVPSLASVFNEWALKRSMDTSLHLQNLLLYFYGLLFNTTGLLLVAAASKRSPAALFRGHSKFTFLLVVNNALQGVLSSFFFKYADTILKKYSSTIATIWTALLSAALFGHHLTLNFLLAVITVACSMHIFFGQGGLKRRSGEGSGEKLKGGSSRGGRGSAEDLLALDADIGDPDNVHFASPERRPSLLPR